MQTREPSEVAENRPEPRSNGEVGEEGRTDEAIVVVVELHGGNLHVQLEGDVVAVPNLANDEHMRSIERLSCTRLIRLATASTRNEPRLCRQAVAH